MFSCCSSDAVVPVNRPIPARVNVQEQVFAREGAPDMTVQAIDRVQDLFRGFRETEDQYNRARLEYRESLGRIQHLSRVNVSEGASLFDYARSELLSKVMTLFRAQDNALQSVHSLVAEGIETESLNRAIRDCKEARVFNDIYEESEMHATELDLSLQKKMRNFFKKGFSPENMGVQLEMKENLQKEKVKVIKIRALAALIEIKMAQILWGLPSEHVKRLFFENRKDPSIEPFIAPENIEGRLNALESEIQSLIGDEEPSEPISLKQIFSNIVENGDLAENYRERMSNCNSVNAKITQVIERLSPLIKEAAGLKSLAKRKVDSIF